jgi:hypothetical protein
VHENKGRERGVKTANREQKAEGRRCRKYATPRGLARPFEAALEAQGRQDGLESRIHNPCCYLVHILSITFMVLVVFADGASFELVWCKRKKTKR